jgi:uncharacterized protein (TIGR00725 family)
VRIPLVAVIGSGREDAELGEQAFRIGRAIAGSGAGLVCGGKGGVMAAAARGAHATLGAGSGRIIGILPGSDRSEANPWLDLALPTGLGHARNVLVVLAADAVIAVGGASGTLSEVAHAWSLGRPIAAWVPGGGWAARIAGQRIDDTRTDTVTALEELPQLELWLEQVTRRPG